MVIGEILAGRFVIEHLVAAGGMGEVYRARDLDTGGAVAVKLPCGHGGDAARFERESRILSRIDDPRVVRYVSHGALASGEPFLAMEWLDGEDLAARLERGPLTAAEAVGLCTLVADALGALHEQGIFHRDLKPSNVFLLGGRSDRPKLLDFGIAHIEASTRLTGTGTLVGTWGYMAPEQVNGTARIDGRADLFSLGCVLLECLSGKPVFNGAHAMAILAKILFEPTPRLRDVCVGAPAALSALVEQLLSKDPAGRPSDGRAAAAALRALGPLPEHALPAAAEGAPPSALTDCEQRALAVIVVSAPPGEAAAGSPEAGEPWRSADTRAHATTLPRSPAGAELPEWLAAEAQAHGANLQRLFDGSLALVLASQRVATDLAAQAAQCALALGRRAPGRRVALAMGRGPLTGKLLLGPAIDRAVRLLSEEQGPPAPCPGEEPQREAPSGTVVLDDAAVRLLDARFDVRQESGVHVLVAERDLAGARTLLGKPTPCVGRERELRALQGFFETCIGDGGGAQAALVTGPPGMGKSRIGRELVARLRARTEPLSVWLARGEPLRAGSAFGLLAGLVQSAAGLRSGEPVEARRQKLFSRVAEHVAASERQRVAEFLGELVGAAFPDETSLPLRAARRDAHARSDPRRVPGFRCGRMRAEPGRPDARGPALG